MKAAMRSIFQRLVPGDQTSLEGYFIKGDDSDIRFLKDSIIIEKETKEYFPYQLLIINDDDTFYFMVLSTIEFGIDFLSTINLRETDISPGMVALFLSEILPKRLSSISDDELNDKIFYPLDELPDYRGHDANKILKYFGSLKSFIINPSIDKKISNCLIEFSINNPNIERAVHEDTHLKLIKECLLFSNKEIIDQFCKILWSKEFDNTYIKLYQLLELLYPIPYIHAVHSELKSTQHNVTELLYLLLDNLDWKYVEINALEKLLKVIPATKLPELNGFDDISNSKDVYTKISKIIYEIRCRIVHKRLKHAKIRFESEQWDQLFLILLKIIKTLYMHYHDIIMESDS